MYREMRCTLPPHPNTSSAPRFLFPLPPWCFHSRSGGIHRNLVPMSHCCPKSVAVAPMGEKIKDAFQSNPLIHTHTYKYTKSTSSHPLPQSVIKGISIETLMKGAHFKGNTFQTLHEKIHRQRGLLWGSSSVRVVSFSWGKVLKRHTWLHASKKKCFKKETTRLFLHLNSLISRSAPVRTQQNVSCQEQP